MRSEIENHLAGKTSEQFHAHMESCQQCRDEVAEMEDIAQIVRELTPALGEVPVPSAAFYARVTQAINQQQPTNAWAQFFSPGRIFFRRVALASVFALAGLFAILLSSESEIDGADATAIMAQYDSARSHAAAAEPDNLFVTLAAYHQ